MRLDQIEIRNATSQDFSSIKSLHTDLYNIHHIGAPDIFKNIQSIVLSTKEIDISDFNVNNIVVATVDSLVVGYLEFFEKTIEESETLRQRKMYCVVDLVVSSEYRGKGIGKMLLGEVENRARLNSFDSVEVPVFTFNRKAQDFYEINGYSEYVTRVRKVLQ